MNCSDLHADPELNRERTCEQQLLNLSVPARGPCLSGCACPQGYVSVLPGFLHLKGWQNQGPQGRARDRENFTVLQGGASPGLASSVQLLNCVPLFATPWTAARQASLSITSSWSLPKLMSIKSVMPSNHLILCHPLLFPPSIFPSIRVFSNESTLRIRWPKYWSFSFNINPSNEH